MLARAQQAAPLRRNPGGLFTLLPTEQILLLEAVFLDLEGAVQVSGTVHHQSLGGLAAAA